MTVAARYHVATPEAGGGPGVLVLHEARGLTADIVWAANRLAAAGYFTVAPDLTGPMGGIVRATAQVLGGRGELIDRAHDEVDQLARRDEVTSAGVAVVGFSMGAALSLLLDGNPSVRVIGFNYGLVSRHALAHRDVPIVASFGARDRLLPRGAAPLVKRLATSAVPHDVVEYEGAGHSFMTPMAMARSPWIARLLGLAMEPGSAESAWGRTLEFLDRHLKSPTETQAHVS